MAKLTRTLRKEYGSKGTKLPPKLAFLKSIRFYAVAKHKLQDGRRQTRIEFLLKPLREFVESVNRAKDIQEENTSLVAQVKALQSLLADQENENSSLKQANEQLMANLDKCKDGPGAERHSSMKTYSQVAEERAFKPTSSKPYPGGNSGLGKKR